MNAMSVNSWSKYRKSEEKRGAAEDDGPSIAAGDCAVWFDRDIRSGTLLNAAPLDVRIARYASIRNSTGHLISAEAESPQLSNCPRWREQPDRR